ncbi:hypothetical protein [Caulobacter sp. FWC2]|uniref:hypothetical protein n=1 Tax=Caulobacter sp. FWC2 TaxID=69664 RepID=UPI000C1493DA|nr:hypothetical protein [Caulobacter sp. FWC2]PIB93417.1 hypothetical protein CSW62_18640 [Caulobacter sp. FWC2]
MAYTTQQLVDLYTNANLGKGPDAALTLTLDAYATQTQVGGLSDDAAAASTLKWVNGTTAVAVETYQFFTGKAPSAAGLAYLVNSATNTTDLNDAYYSKFSAENRFINFSINLAVFGDGAANFAAQYGNTATSTVTYAQVVASAYDKIIGNATATAAGVDVAASVAFFSRQANIDYLTSFVKANGITGATQIDLAVKAALIGEILNAATVSGLGAYATATTALIKDLSDGALTNTDSASIFVSYPAGPTVGEVKNLTTAIDTIKGTSAADTYTGVWDQSNGGVNSTLNALDIIGGGAGQDTLNINAVTSLSSGNLSSLTITGIETINIRGAGGVEGDFSGYDGLTALNVTQSQGVDVAAAATTAISIANSTGDVYTAGGSTVNVTDSTSGNNIYVGYYGAAKGAVSVTDANLGNRSIYVATAGDVSVTATKTDSSYIGVGDNNGSSVYTSGAVVVNTTGVAYAGGGFSAGEVDVYGGSTVTISQAATSSTAFAADYGSNTGNTIYAGYAYTYGSAKQTSVTVNQSAAVEAVDAVAAQGTQEVQTVTFSDVTAGTTVSVNGLNFKAAVDLTAAQVASAFANLARSATVGSASASLGSYSGAFTTLSGTTGAATADGKVTYTGSVSYTAGDQALLTTTNASASTVTDGVTYVDAVAGVAGIQAGYININGNITGADVLSTVSVKGGESIYVYSDALTSLKLASTNGTVQVQNATSTALALGLDTVGATLIDGTTKDAATLVLGSTYTTLNVTNAGTNLVDVIANGVKTLTIGGAGSVNTITNSTSASALNALETITVTGTAGLTYNATGAGSTGLKSIDTTGTTGSVTSTISAVATSYAGGAGKDSVTLSNTTVTKDITLGAGDDTLTLATGTTSVTGALAGGDGTDTLSMAAADAQTLSANAAFAGHISGFEKIKLGAVTGGTSATVDLANLGNAAYVISSNAAAPGAASALIVNTTQGVAATTTESSDITFGGLVAGQSYTVAGRTVTASGTATAADVATAFSSGTSAGNLTVSGTLTGWTAAAGASAHTVFTSTTATTNVTDITTSTNTSNGSLTINHLANNGTLELGSAGAGVTVNMTDATGTADTLNLALKVSTSSLNFGSVTASGVESINIAATDSVTSTINTATVALADTALKSVVITGNAAVTLTSDSVALTSIDGSAMTGKLTAASSVTGGATLTGGAGADVLTGNGANDKLIGGAGGDTLVVHGNLQTLTGGTGADTFDVGYSTTNANSYATITDLAAGDFLKFADTGSVETFTAAKLSLGDTAVFQDFANLAIASTDTGAITWFQYAGNTYVVENISNDTSSFVNASDVIVKITGLVDLSTASLNTATGTGVVLGIH